MMVADFRHRGMVACDSERLNNLVRTPTSWSAQAQSTFPKYTIRTGCFPGVHSLQHLPHLVFLECECVVTGGLWCPCSCVWGHSLEAGKEGIQFLSQ